jgi:prepilin-type N-terminal cleavage/methylation domain-containing protein
MRSHRTTTAGFSVIELVIVILVIGIVSAVALTRALRSDSYNAIIARDQLVSMAQSAQQKAIGRSDVRLVLQPVGNNVQFRIEDSTGLVESAEIASASVLARGDVNELGSCDLVAGGALITVAAPMVLNYNALGDLLNGGVTGSPGFPQTISTGARVCINDDPQMSVCLSSAGYAYVGNCVE